MICPKCKGDTGVRETRGEDHFIMRWRFCKTAACKHTFRTFEVADHDNLIGYECPIVLPRGELARLLATLNRLLGNERGVDVTPVK